MSIKKIVFGLAAIVLLFGLSGSVSAQTVDINSLLQQIALLQSQIAALSGTPTGTGACAFTQNLTIGSSGAEVTCLQNYLISGDYSIPAGATGYFGPQTQSAVAAWQRANAVSPASGLFGPISRAAYNSMAGVTTPPLSGGALCPNGNPISNNCAPVTPPPTGPLCPNGNPVSNNCMAVTTTPEPLCPNGMTIASNCATAPGTTPPPATGTGLVTTSVALESSPSDGTDVTRNRPANAVDIARWKIRASNSDGILKQFGIKATHRPWLYWSKAQLVVGGNVIAEMANLSSADFSEVTSGSDYRLVFSGLNQTLTKDTDTFVILRVYSSTDSGRTAASGLTITQVSNSMVVADADTPSYSVTDGNTSNRTYDFIAASTANIVPSGNAVSKGNRWVKVSESGTTPFVTLHVFDLKAEQRPATITSLKPGINAAGGANISTLITSYDLYEGSCPEDGSITGCTLLAGGAVNSTKSGNDGALASASSSLQFTNLSIVIPAETKKTFTIKALLADEDDFTAAQGTAASTSIQLSQTNIAGHDDNFDTLTVSGSNVTSHDIHAILKSPAISNASLTLTKQATLDQFGDIKSTFTMSASGGTVYVSSAPSTMLATSTTASTTYSNATGINTVQVNPTTLPCDTDNTNLYCIPEGTPRTFTFTGSLNNGGNGGDAGTVRNFKITRVNFDTDVDDTTYTDFYFDTTFASMAALNDDEWLDSRDRTQ
ncbi:MAG: peptidoglycan-binding protein [Candidatus Vogelbacteria bacterium]|nr:peptidoglycan-binding protein [Candidatus Vogelbacteria bacterium]